ncbi:hypothetical protein L207DRAFT_165959 [Hyaloscypha variabilis F]|uniref:Uncharacterized protein n=1 Tax=Hyaloscypha variabilis (strain UAMH 11265 / GT02V1 / F) TaxID=1149755 RepID=A0A2J6SAX0_HYAVF|nr:hypothetical protein L207DRAFT_165959 [Hyaloscypha variabilis F]
MRTGKVSVVSPTLLTSSSSRCCFSGLPYRLVGSGKAKVESWRPCSSTFFDSSPGFCAVPSAIVLFPTIANAVLNTARPKIDVVEGEPVSTTPLTWYLLERLSCVHCILLHSDCFCSVGVTGAVESLINEVVLWRKRRGKVD